MSPGFSFLVSSCRLVERLVPYHRRGVRSWRVSGLAVLLVGVSSWRRRHSFFLRRGGVLVLILCLSSRPLLVPPSCVASRLLVLPCPAGSGSVACLLVPSCLFFSWGGRCRSWCRGVLPCFPVSSDLLFSCRRSWRLVSRLGEHLVGVSSSMMYPLRRRGVLAAPRGFVSSHRLVERGGFGFSSHLGGERMGGGSRHAVSEPVLACLDAVGDGGNAVLIIGVPACSLSSYGCGAWGRAAPPPIWLIVACFLSPGLSLLPRAVYPIRGGRDGRRGGGRACLDIVAWLIVSRRWMYIMNMMYAMYIKDTRI